MKKFQKWNSIWTLFYVLIMRIGQFWGMKGMFVGTFIFQGVRFLISLKCLSDLRIGFKIRDYVKTNVLWSHPSIIFSLAGTFNICRIIMDRFDSLFGFAICGVLGVAHVAGMLYLRREDFREIKKLVSSE